MSSKDESRKRFEGRAKDEKPTEGSRTQSTHTRMQGTRARKLDCKNLRSLGITRIYASRIRKKLARPENKQGRIKDRRACLIVFVRVYTVEQRD